MVRGLQALSGLRAFGKRYRLQGNIGLHREEERRLTITAE